MGSIKKMDVIDVPVPQGTNVILGHSHFIKTVEDLYEALITSSTSIRFGLAFNEASGDRLVRSDGNDEELIKLAEEVALKIGAGHTFVIYLKNAWPINVLNAIKNVQEVCRIYTATANPVQVIVAETDQGRAVLGVVDGFTTVGIETQDHKKHRHEFLRKIGYKR
ncbi:MAG: adenosine monophosphate-protein transferase [Zestosphaera tikiterensis]|uniref:Adenosine monophosphate-protein transferase n=1 Tax=Zestosphaera tikiterensis TaxID=1973259 RepID=A0A2R7Y6D3_9CREN|nr:MAG: adenosine monophosphate-protein transferase [Zestosphaera tikiterensis]